eukprot:2150831-Rhodomonas_salina.2
METETSCSPCGTHTRTWQASRRPMHARTFGKAESPLVALSCRQVVEPDLDSAPLRIHNDRVQGRPSPRRHAGGPVQHSPDGATAQVRSKLTDVALGQAVWVGAGNRGGVRRWRPCRLKPDPLYQSLIGA